MANWFAKLQSDFVLNFVDDNRWKYLTSGLANTLKITFFAVILGIALGVVAAIIRSTHDKTVADMRPGFGRFILKVLNLIVKLYLTVIRGIPMVVLLLIFFYIVFASAKNGIPVRR